MSALEPLYSLMGVSTFNLSKNEIYILEAELFISVCEKLKEFFRSQYREYFRLLQITIEQENIMLEVNFLPLIMKDIISSNEYTLEGIARYTDTHEDILHEVLDGRNTRPSATLLRRVIELHRSIRRELYSDIMKKVAIQYLAVA
jgi:hypothetical protein